MKFAFLHILLMVPEKRKGSAKMDFNENDVTGGGYGLRELPIGFSFGLAENESAMKSYAGLSETEKEHLLMRCRDAKSKSEMQEIVNSLIPDTDLRAVVEEQRDTAVG